jgi:hypothetical protein
MGTAPNPVDQSPVSKQPWERLAPLVLIATAALAYHNSLAGPFIFDDVLNVQNN